MTFMDIPASRNWKKIQKIEKGWSDDLKYYIESDQGRKLLLRISDGAEYEEKKEEFEMIERFAESGIEMSAPIDFGTCSQGGNVYMLLKWVEGEDLELALPKLTMRQQYEKGREAGILLKKIHSIPVPEEVRPVETKIPKKKRQLESYMNSDMRIAGDEDVIAFVLDNLHRIWKMEPVYLHGDFHPGNLILTPDQKIGVIDFNRWEIGDPYEEFYKLESFGSIVSVPYCTGQIDSYFADCVPDAFWESLAVYAAHAALFSIKWAEKFGQQEIDKMIEIYRRSFAHFDGFKSCIPSWYRKAPDARWKNSD